MYEKRKILIHRLVWFALLLLTVVFSIVYWTNWLYDADGAWYILILYLDIFIPAIFIGTLLLSCKTYGYNDIEIIVYAGWYHHYMKINGTKFDEHNTLISFTAISLSCTLDDGTDLKATITMTNRISLKINNKLYTKGK